MRGVSELARMTPEAVEARYGVPPARYPDLAAIVGETSDNLPGVPGVGPGFAARWLNEYDGLDNVITHADKITGKKGEALREHLGDVIRNRQPQRAGPRPRPRAGSRRPRGPVVGPPAGAHPVRLPGVPGAARAAAGVVGRPARADRRVRASSSPASGSAPGEVGRLARRAHRRGPHRRDRPRTVGLGHRRGLVRGLRGRRRHRRLGRRRRGLARGRRGAHDLVRRRRAHQGAPRREGPDARAGGARVVAAGTGQRHRPGGVPRPTRPAVLRPGRPDAALPQARAQAGRRPTTVS